MKLETKIFVIAQIIALIGLIIADHLQNDTFIAYITGIIAMGIIAVISVHYERKMRKEDDNKTNTETCDGCIWEKHKPHPGYCKSCRRLTTYPDNYEKEGDENE